MDIYVVKEGDSVDSIALNYNIPVFKLVSDNQILWPYKLAIGQSLIIIGENECEYGVRNIRTNGYAYPFISRWVLDNMLSYISYMSVFSYGFTMDGDIIPPELNDDFMIEIAVNKQTVPVLTLTPLGPDGKFNNELITSVVNNEEIKWKLIYELLNVMKVKGFQGVDIDFEFIKKEDRDKFTEFVNDVAVTMRNNSFFTTIALAPKTSSDQPGLLYEGKDYKALGEVTDGVLLMTYEWGYKYGPPMAVAPLNMVRRVIDYAVTEIDREKINIGIPNYGYDWPLPFVAGTTEAVTIGNIEAVNIAVKYGAEILFDEVSASPYFYYYDEYGTEHVVWFEDVRSLQEKYGLINEYGLEGLGYWNIQRWFKPMVLLLDCMFGPK